MNVTHKETCNGTSHGTWTPTLAPKAYSLTTSPLIHRAEQVANGLALALFVEKDLVWFCFGGCGIAQEPNTFQLFASLSSKV